MSKDSTPAAPPVNVVVNKGHQPRLAMDGHQPKPMAVAFPQSIQGGHQPTTSQAAPANPPNQGSSGKK
jgi:hypothetical protein